MRSFAFHFARSVVSMGRNAKILNRLMIAAGMYSGVQYPCICGITASTCILVAFRIYMFIKELANSGRHAARIFRHAAPENTGRTRSTKRFATRMSNSTIHNTDAAGMDTAARTLFWVSHSVTV